MFRQPTADELEQFTVARERADRAYNQALTVLDRAIAQKPELPPAATGFDAAQISPLNASWRLAPDEGLEGGPGWRRHLKRLVWRLIRPVMQRQQRFNALLVDHLTRNVRAATEHQAAAVGLVEVLNGYLEALAIFQSRLIQYLQQITLYVDTKDRHEVGQVRSICEGLGAALDRVTDDFQKRSEQIDLLTAATHAMKREITRLHVSPNEPPDRAEVGHARPTATLNAYKYVCFEDLFRGPREAVTGCQRAYLPYFEGASDVLDLGCGRGEFLTLLLEQRISARGVDTNAEAVERCRARGLDVAQADALKYVCALPDASIGGLFSAQVVEHLEAEYLMQVLDEVNRALRPGSRVVLETINPACWLAFFSAYVRDPTHRHPLHPDTLTYLLRASGFVDVAIVYSSPVDDQAQLQRVDVDSRPVDSASRALAETLNQHADRLNSLLFTSQDYAAVARRP